MEDIKIDEIEDVVIEEGDFGITDDGGEINDRQNIYDIVGTFLGHWRGKPFMGVGLKNYLNSPDGSKLKSKIQEQLYADSFRIYSIDGIDDLEEVDININAKHK